MIRLIVLVYMFFALPVCANVFDNETTLDKITKELPELHNVKCKFKQEKQISNMVLNSSGDFIFDCAKGVTFYTTYPVVSTTSYSSREYRQINSIITAISNKSYSGLEKNFKFYFDRNAKNWSLGLMPKSGTPAYNYLKSIEIVGSENIDKIVILTYDKTKTTIRFEQ